MDISSTYTVPWTMDSDELLTLLKTATADCVSGSDIVAIAYSGGVDSALVERVARETAETVCYTCAVEDSHDHARAPAHATADGAELRMIVLDRSRLVELVSTASSLLGTANPLRIAYTVPVLCVIDESEPPLVLVGSGADELFGGYAKYLENPDPASAMAVDIKKMQSEHDILRKYAKSIGKELAAPFASDELVSFARDLPLDRKLRGGERKVILREVAKSLGIRSHDAPKKAAQYSSGVMKEMRRMAREQGKGLDEWTGEIAARGRRIP